MSSSLLDRVLGCPNLPSLPAVALQLLELTRDENVQLTAIADLVQNDPALCGKILKTVNSSYYALAKPCPTIPRALAYLGLSTVKSLVLGFSLVEWAGRDDEELDLADYWRRSVFAAAAARRLALASGGCDPEEAFIGALVQDIGVLAMRLGLGKDYVNVVAATQGDHQALPGKCREIFGFDHAEVGAELASKWRLPPQLVLAIRHHHDADADLKAQDELVRIVAISNRLASTITRPDPFVGLRESSRTIASLLQLAAAEIADILASAADDAQQLSKLLAVNVGRYPDVAAMLAQAQEALIEHQIRVQRETEQLRQSNETLARAALTDGLTKVGNRKRFDQEIASRFDFSRRAGSPLGLVIVDADKFKSVNDTHGHPAGDAVLVQLAARIREQAGTEGIVCRFGGEEFVVLLPNHGLTETARVAEKIRKSVASRPMDLASVKCSVAELAVTASLGVAVLSTETAEMFTTGALLLQAADKALYNAKQSGRNCVRVFQPRKRASAAA